jgi:hypothetical protein
MHRLLAMIALWAGALSGCGGGSTPASAAGKPAAAPAKSAAAPAAAPAAAADEPVIDVCALFPRPAIETALGKIDRTRSLNVTDPGKGPMRTPGGSGGCFWEGAKLGVHARVEIHTASGLARQGLGSPRRYIDMGWAIGADASAIDGLGEVARTRPTKGMDHEIIAGNASRTVHLLASGISREQAIAIVRAGLEMKLP